MQLNASYRKEQEAQKRECYVFKTNSFFYFCTLRKRNISLKIFSFAFDVEPFPHHLLGPWQLHSITQKKIKTQKGFSENWSSEISRIWKNIYIYLAFLGFVVSHCFTCVSVCSWSVRDSVHWLSPLKMLNKFGAFSWITVDKKNWLLRSSSFESDRVGLGLMVFV